MRQPPPAHATLPLADHFYIVVTGMASWTLIFGLSFLTMKVAIRLRRFLRRSSDSHSLRSESFWSSGSTFTTVVETEYKGDTGPDDGSPAVSPQASFYKTRGSTHSGKIINYYPIVLSLTCALAIGAPVAAATKDTRLLDGCALWFSWISAVRIQGWMKNSSLWAQNPSAKKACSTCLNPVLLTILVMLGYVRAKAAATPGVDLPYIIKKFRCGRPLYHIWTESIRESTSSEKTSHYFGAGDAALSLLECGMVVWGFRLYECRRQLFSMTGIVTVIVSAAAAAGNVYFSVACARVMGLDTPEALSFAARSVTLALARPAVQTAGGNLAVNAAIVVSNGIVGQLICPYALAALKVQHECPAAEPMILSSSVTSTKDADIGDDGQRASIWVQDVEKPPGTRISQEDDAMTVAAGMAIGINGAAMGVAYLYESKNRAAPYSALAMTVFGVMTVVFTAAGPFKDTVLNLAGV